MSEIDLGLERKVLDHLILINGKSGSGKSASLRGITEQERWAYLNLEAGKRLPFPSKFNAPKVVDVYQVPVSIEGITGNPDFDGIIIDSFSFMMARFESDYVVTSPNTQAAWGSYKQFALNLMQQSVGNCDKTVIFTSHIEEVVDKETGERTQQAVCSGGLSKLSFESFFSCIVTCKKVKLRDLERDFKELGVEPDKDGSYSAYLNITPKEKLKGEKHVFMTDTTARTTHERSRAPLGMWEDNELYIDNNIQYLHERLQQYYA